MLAALAPTRDLAWDAGCGSGQLSTLLAERFARVIATDASPQQIARARPHQGVEYRVAPAETSGLAAGTVDMCVAAQAAHWFDLERYYSEVRRVARPGGVIALVMYGRAGLEAEVAAPFDRIQELLTDWWPPERAAIDRFYEGLPFPFDEVRVAPLGMSARWPLEHLLGYVETWSPTLAFVRERGRAPLDALIRPLRETWGDPERLRDVRWPLGMRIGRVSGAG